ncbi:RNA-binding protein [Variovorax dokdonensis]|uniref:RNA-binding protein n=1 Tax=Variovorax dokdonensis TaxID=344883 RepID=A0ABT7NDS3_9BURK|nr:RNA-binding protein [Variovorax dokdonensis]MDM0046083.1 RNA-binding protein [Variovorax dokdonensis]
MTCLILGNIEPGTSEETLAQFLAKYGFPPFASFEEMPGDGSQLSVMLHYDDLPPETLHRLRERIHGMFWNHRKLTADTVIEKYD